MAQSLARRFAARVISLWYPHCHIVNLTERIGLNMPVQESEVGLLVMAEGNPAKAVGRPGGAHRLGLGLHIEKQYQVAGAVKVRHAARQVSRPQTSDESQIIVYAVTMGQIGAVFRGLWFGVQRTGQNLFILHIGLEQYAPGDA